MRNYKSIIYKKAIKTSKRDFDIEVSIDELIHCGDMESLVNEKFHSQNKAKSHEEWITDITYIPINVNSETKQIIIKVSGNIEYQMGSFTSEG